ncbi:uncharacterized protein [Narcine bancroftii]|uniref:uncharacterized protein n=1 Tax=Narcine bancroftii TaxID=1343680 RepID=UPI0038319CF5
MGFTTTHSPKEPVAGAPVGSMMQQPDARTNKEHLKCLFAQLQNFRITINLSKCQFGLSSIDFFGYCISSEGATPLLDKVKVIRNFPRPTVLQELLGMENFYHCFLPGAAAIMRPLFELIKEGKKEPSWSVETLQAIVETKTAISKATFLAHPDPDLPRR